MKQKYQNKKDREAYHLFDISMQLCFKNLPNTVQDELYRRSDKINVAKNSNFTVNFTNSTGMLIVVSGALECEVSDGGRTTDLPSTLTGQQVFWAETDTEIFVFSHDDCRCLLAREPSFARDLVGWLLRSRFASDHLCRFVISAETASWLDEAIGQVFHRAEIAARLASEARVAATQDSLTGLANRLKLEEDLSARIKRAKRRSEQFAVFYLDLDGFKAVNDLYGHAGGDDVLVAVGQRLDGCVREVDTLARVGGDEFVVLQDLGGAGDRGGAIGAVSMLLRRLLAVFDTPIEWRGHALSVRASVGVALFPEDGTSGQALIELADRAMYARKRQGQGGATQLGQNAISSLLPVDETAGPGFGATIHA